MKRSMILSIFALTPWLFCGCPQTGSVESDTTDAGNASNATQGSGNGGSSTSGSGGGSTQTESKTGIFISTPAGATGGLYDIYEGSGTTPVRQALDTNEIEEVDPGTYLLTRYFNTDFVYAVDVKVVAGAVTEVAFGALNVTTVADSDEATFDIWDAAGAKVLTRAQSDNTILPLPPGTYVIREYFNDVFSWAVNVQIVAGQVTTIPLGAFYLKSNEDWANANYDVYAADGATLLSRPKGINRQIPLPAGSFVMVDYFNDAFPFANVQVAAGAVTHFELGAILYNGGESNYDIYDASGTKLLERPGSRGAPRGVPPGTYVLKDYFSDVVLADGIEVSAGVVTEVQ
ncbi:MAG: hypothetical protein JNG88_11535 [Phycisphaerales bacterium]|nr:hypothetical protein [Phycisphaerales bacterium]